MAASQEKQMEVCEVCGAFLIVGDAQQRIDDHLTGKQHVGFAKLRQAIQEIRDVSSRGVVLNFNPCMEGGIVGYQ